MTAACYLLAAILLAVAAIMAAVAAPRWQAVALFGAAAFVLASGWPAIAALS